MAVEARPGERPLARITSTTSTASTTFPRMHERIGIVGLGAIGGALALAWRDHAPTVAWSRDAADRDAARAAGISVCREEGSAWLNEMADSTAIVVAVPLDEVAGVVQALHTQLPDECLLLHVASLQGRDALGMSDVDFRRVLGTHPMAGAERSGFGAAHVGMFRGATVRAEARATEVARGRIEQLWRATGVTRIVWDDASAHDELMSWVSHLPQLTATAVAAALADRGVDPDDLGPGGRDVTRLAASDLAVWTPILQRAPRQSADALRRLTSTIDAMREALERHDARALAVIWEEAHAWKVTVEKP